MEGYGDIDMNKSIVGFLIVLISVGILTCLISCDVNNKSSNQPSSQTDTPPAQTDNEVKQQSSCTEIDKQLFDALDKGQMTRIRELLEAGANVNAHCSELPPE